MTEIVAVGAADQPPTAVLGHVTDAVIDAHRNVYVLDALSFHVKVFSRVGVFLASAGRRGPGPGEFLAPVSIAIRGADEVLVLDQSNSRIERWRFSGKALDRIGSYPIPFFARKMCVLGTRIFVLGHHGSNLLHELDQSGAIARSFAPGPLQQTTTQARLRAPNQLWCDEEAGELVIAHRLYPELFIYSANGSLRKTIRAEPFRQIVVTTRGAGVVTYSNPKDGPYDVIVSTAVIGTRRIVQLGHDVDGSDAVSGVRSYEVTSQGVFRRIAPLPRLLKDSRGMALVKQVDPYPRLLVYSVSW
jgi:hypothetical protein